jgi:hypothetical protein
MSIIPVQPANKKPYEKWAEFQTRIATEEEITAWWTKYPEAMIGIVTGKISNTFVVDLDKYAEGYSEETALEYFPDDLITPSAATQSGGEHLYFKYIALMDSISITSRILPGIDYRGNGGYVIAPPSSNGNGKCYSWNTSIDETPMAELPLRFLQKISINKTSTLYENVTKPENQPTSVLQPVTLSFARGSRDNSLFHVAHTMTKGGAKPGDVRIVLDILAKQCSPVFPPDEVNAKIASAIDRAQRKERNIARELAAFVDVTSGYFSVTDCYMMLQVVTKEEKAALRVALNRLKDSGKITKHGDKDGVYKRVDETISFITFDENEAPEREFPIRLPLGLNDLVEVSEKNIILVAGEFNSGKTTFLLNILKDNKERNFIRYITSEMSKSEFKKRFSGFGLPLSFWMQSAKTEYIAKSGEFHTVIRPDGINIIDYMEFADGDYTRGAEYMKKIHDALTTGVAIVAIQKKEKMRLPRSGDLVMEKPRLAIAFSKYDSNGENPQGLCEVIKCKMPKMGKVDGKKLRFEILNDWGYLRY